LTDNPNTPEDPTDQLAIGEARSRGVELDIQGQITERLGLIVSYAYTDTKIVKDESGRQGNRLPLVPYNAGSVWAKYDLTSRFSVGAGLFTVGRREVDEDNSAQLPGYVRLDAMAAYRWQLGGGRLTAQLNLNNLTDEKYFETAFNRNSIIPGDPLLVFGSLRFEY
jgi:iron complex outermembrane receptor protein